MSSAAACVIARLSGTSPVHSTAELRWFATAECEHAVEVWSLAERRLMSSFETVLDPGGRRLALLAEDRPIVVAGAYHRHGICAYDALSGDRLWQRKELKRV
jgi:hypothetical protein